MNKRIAMIMLILALAGLMRPGPAVAEIPQPVTVQAVAQQIETKVRQRFEAENLRVEVMPFDDDYYTQQGRFQWIVVSADKAMRDGVAIRDLFIKTFDVTLELEPLFAENIVINTLSSGRNIITARLYEADMNTMLSLEGDWQCNSGLQDMQVDCQDGTLKFTGKYKWIVVSDIELIGTLKVMDHSQVDFEAQSAKMNGIPLPAGPLKSILRKLNPVIDFQNVPLEPPIESVTITTEYILVRG